MKASKTAHTPLLTALAKLAGECWTAEASGLPVDENRFALMRLR